MKSKLILVTENLDLMERLRELVDKNPFLSSQLDLNIFNRKAWLENLENPFLRSQLMNRPISSMPDWAAYSSEKLNDQKFLPSGQIGTESNLVPFPHTYSGPSQVIAMDEVEKLAIIQALEACRGNMSLVAKTLKVGRATLYRKIKTYNIDPHAFKKRKTRTKKVA
jgi:transcriptional regulator with AAA-type ATPase domain